ncbi:hypothetical protein D3C76_1679710 [compost metagenome]
MTWKIPVNRICKRSNQRWLRPRRLPLKNSSSSRCRPSKAMPAALISRLNGKGCGISRLNNTTPQKATVRTLPRPRNNFIPRPY